jgi:hypothetical protein
MTIAYINDFKLMMWLVLALVPLVFVLNSTKPKATAEAAISSSSQR